MAHLMRLASAQAAPARGHRSDGLAQDAERRQAGRITVHVDRLDVGGPDQERLVIDADVPPPPHPLDGLAPPLRMGRPSHPGFQLVEAPPVLKDPEVVDRHRERFRAQQARPVGSRGRAEAAISDRRRRAKSQAERLFTWIPSRTRQAR